MTIRAASIGSAPVPSMRRPASITVSLGIRVLQLRP
jgi:hypothetical protein